MSGNFSTSTKNSKLSPTWEVLFTNDPDEIVNTNQYLILLFEQSYNEWTLVYTYISTKIATKIPQLNYWTDVRHTAK